MVSSDPIGDPGTEDLEAQAICFLFEGIGNALVRPASPALSALSAL